MSDIAFRIFTRKKPKGLAFHLYLPLATKPHGQKRARVTPLLGYDLTEEEAIERATTKIKEILQAQRGEISNPVQVLQGDHTLAHGVTLYWQMMDIQDRVEFERPRFIIQKHLLPFFGEFPLVALTPEMGLRYVTARKKAGKAIGTIRREWNVFTRILNLCVDAGWIPRNPMRLITKNLPKAGRRQRTATPDELQALEQHSLPELWRIILVALHTGLRESKLLAIEDTWLRVEEDGYWLVLPEARSAIKGNPVKIPLNIQALRALFPDIAAMPKGRIFGRWINRNSFRTQWKKTLLRAGITGLTFHDLRHTYATRLQNVHVDYEVRQHLLGHKIKGETASYSHGGPGWDAKLREAVKRLEQYEVDARVEASISASNQRPQQVIEKYGAEAQNRTADTSLFRALGHSIKSTTYEKETDTESP